MGSLEQVEEIINKAKKADGLVLRMQSIKVHSNGVKILLNKAYVDDGIINPNQKYIMILIPERFSDTRKELIMKDSGDISKIYKGFITSDEIREKSLGLITIYNYKPSDQLENKPIQYKLNNINNQLDKTTISESSHEKYLNKFAHVELASPIVHVAHAKSLLNMLNSICSNCGRILLTDEQLQNRIFRHRRYIHLYGKTNKAIYFNLLKTIKDITKCDCGTKKRKISFEKPIFFFEEGRTCEENYGRPLYFYEVLLSRGETKEAEKIATQLMVVDIRDRIENLSPEIWNLFGLNPSTVFLDVLPIPLEYFKMSKDLNIEFQKNDEIAETITDFIKVNQTLKDRIDKFAVESNKNDDPLIILLHDLWNLLQYCCSTFLNKEKTGVLSERLNYVLKGIKSRKDFHKIEN